MKFVLTLWMIFLVNSGHAGILDFKDTVDDICDPIDKIVTKKILLQLISFKDDPKAAKCNFGLKLLTSKCQNKVECHDILVSFSDFFRRNSSNLIGE